MIFDQVSLLALYEIMDFYDIKEGFLGFFDSMENGNPIYRKRAKISAARERMVDQNEKTAGGGRKRSNLYWQ